MKKMLKGLVISVLVMSQVSAQAQPSLVNTISNTITGNKGLIATTGLLATGAAYCYYNPESTVEYAGKCLYSAGQFALPYATSYAKTTLISLAMRKGFDLVCKTTVGSTGISQGTPIVDNNSLAKKSNTSRAASKAKKIKFLLAQLKTRSYAKKIKHEIAKPKQQQQQQKTSFFKTMNTTLANNKGKIALGVLALGAVAYAYYNQDTLVNGLNTIKDCAYQKVRQFLPTTTYAKAPMLVQPTTPTNEVFGKLHAKNLFRQPTTPTNETFGKLHAENLFRQPIQTVKQNMVPTAHSATPVAENSPKMNFFGLMLNRIKKGALKNWNYNSRLYPDEVYEAERSFAQAIKNGSLKFSNPDSTCAQVNTLIGKLSDISWKIDRLAEYGANVMRPLNTVIGAVQGALNIPDINPGKLILNTIPYTFCAVAGPLEGDSHANCYDMMALR